MFKWLPFRVRDIVAVGLSFAQIFLFALANRSMSIVCSALLKHTHGLNLSHCYIIYFFFILFSFFIICNCATVSAYISVTAQSLTLSPCLRCVEYRALCLLNAHIYICMFVLGSCRFACCLCVMWNAATITIFYSTDYYLFNNKRLTDDRKKRRTEYLF